MLCHRCYANNLEAPLCGPALLVVPEVINFVRCIVLLLLVARLLFIYFIITTGQTACQCAQGVNNTLRKLHKYIIQLVIDLTVDIKTHDSELQGQESTRQMQPLL